MDLCQQAQKLIAQIKDRRYAKALEKYSGNILVLGINDDKEEKRHSCVIEEREKSASTAMYRGRTISVNIEEFWYSVRQKVENEVCTEYFQ